MKELDNFMNKIGVDKILHFFVGAWICSIVSFIAILQENNLLWWQKILMPAIGLFVTIFFSLIKEFFLDEKFDIKDVLWSIYGAVTILLSVIIGVIFNILSY